MKIKKIIFYLVCISFCSVSYGNDCYKSIYVEQKITSFKANMLFPKITTNKKNTNIYITCDMYNNVKVGDYLTLPETIKKFNEERILNFIPQGSLDKVQYKVLKK